MNVFTSNPDIKNFNLKIDDVEYDADDLLRILHELDIKETMVDEVIYDKLISLNVVEPVNNNIVKKSSNFGKFYNKVSKIYSKNIKSELKKKQLVA